MEHKRVDALMKQVEEQCYSIFSINGNKSLSERIADRIRKKAEKKFIGNNGNFTAEKMFVTDGTVTDNTSICLNPNGIVHGPYVDFMHGDYYAYFYLNGDISCCKLSVEAAGYCFASAAAQELKVVDNAYELPFTLHNDIQKLELKVYNQGTEAVTFERVTVSGVSLEKHRAAVMQRDSTAIDEMELEQHGAILQEMVEKIHDEQRIVYDQIDSIQQQAECTLPSNTRLYNIKRVLRKFMKPFTSFQIMFNHSLVRMLHQVVSQINGVMDAIAVLYRSQLAQQKKIDKLEQLLEYQKQAMYDQMLLFRQELKNERMSSPAETENDKITR